MEFSRLTGREAPSSFFSVGDFVGTASFDNAFLCFRFAAWESTSVRSCSEFDEESEDWSLFRFNGEEAGVDPELTDDILTLASATGRQQSSHSVRIGPRQSNLLHIENPTNVSSKILYRS
jgi:hypothetical protein